MRPPGTGVLAALLAALPLSSAFAVEFKGGSKLVLESDYLYSYNRITGSSISNSYLTEGRRFIENMSMSFTTRLGPMDWETAADGRLADDSRVETRRGSLTRAYTKVVIERHSLVLGDYLGSFSERTLGKSLKGAQYSFKSETAEFTALAGIDKPRWDQLWMYDPEETLDRKVYGARAAKRFWGEGLIAANAVWVRDLRSHTDTETEALKQRVFSGEWALPALWRFRFYGESAFSRTDHDLPTWDEDGNPIHAFSSEDGWDHIVHGDFDFKGFTTANEFERVSPRYATAVGAASPDLFRVETKNTMNLVGAWKWIVLNYTYFHDNLNHVEDGETTTTRMPETGLRFDGPELRPTFYLEAKVRQREVTRTSDARRKRVRSVISSAADRLGPLSLSVDYEFQHEDHSDATLTARHHILGGAANLAKEWGSGWKANAGARWDLQKDRDNLIAKVDQTGTGSYSAGIETPWGLDAGGGYTRTLVLPSENPGSDRRVINASLGYSVLKRRELRLELRFKQNDNRFDTPELDFKEMVWEAGVKVSL